MVRFVLISLLHILAAPNHPSFAELPVAVKRLHYAIPANTHRYNFVVAILIFLEGKWSFHCGGSIVEPRKVVTAAHCVFDSEMNLPPPKILAVIAGDKSWTASSNFSVVARVAAIFSHENYISVNSEPDLAVLILKDDLPIDNVSIGIVQIANEPVRDGQQCLALGWGLNEKKHISKTLMAANFEIQPIDACILFFGVPSPNFICGMSTDRSSVCTGDSGGPLVCDNQLYGIIDSSSVNCSSSKPSLFTELTQYVRWIKRAAIPSGGQFLKFNHSLCSCFLVIYFFY